MNHGDASQESRRKKRPNACIACRDRKVRCSGTHPCTNCVRRSTSCTFGADDRKITVSERFLNDLKRRAAQNTGEDGRAPKALRRASPSPSNLVTASENHESQIPAEPGRESNNVEITLSTLRRAPGDRCSPILDNETQIANPLDSGRSRFCIDNNGRRRFLGPSSTWAYTRQVIDDIKMRVAPENSPETPVYVDGKAYEFDWSISGDAVLTMKDLPSLDHALYLMNTVKFYIAQLYHLFDETTFTEGLYRFYSPGMPETPASTLWYIQYLLVLAFGKTYLVQREPGDPPPGALYFARAMKLLPDIKGLYSDTMLSIEIICSVSLYLQCIDHRNTAYVYLGIALRIALSQGFHREVDIGHSVETSSTRHRSIWWTLYILDRRFSALMGAPVSIHDSDVTVTLPNSGLSTQRCEALAMHVKLSRIISDVLNSVYGLDSRLNQSFIRSVQEALRSLAALAPELAGRFSLNSTQAEPISRVAGTLNLCYHQCVILATRPVLVHLLFEKMANPASRSLSISPIKALTKTCFESAEKSLRVLAALQSQDLLESFLPFDIDCVHSSTFVILLIKSIENVNNNSSHMAQTEEILSTMIRRGSVPAQYRLSELQVLQELLRLLKEQSSQQRIPASPQPTIPNRSSSEVPGNVDACTNNILNDDVCSFSHFADAVGDTGLSPSGMLEVARLLEWGDAFTETLCAPPDQNFCG